MSEIYIVYIRGISGTSVSDLLRYIASRSVGIYFYKIRFMWLARPAGWISIVVHI